MTRSLHLNLLFTESTIHGNSLFSRDTGIVENLFPNIPKTASSAWHDIKKKILCDNIDAVTQPRRNDWTFPNWRRIWFSDDSRLLQEILMEECIYTSNERKFFLSLVCRRWRVSRRKAFWKGYIYALTCYPIISMLKDGDPLWPNSDLVLVLGNLTDQRNNDESLQPHLASLIESVIPTGHAKPHTAHRTSAYLPPE